jgi:hypothetical protein
VTEALIVEIRNSIGRELGQLQARLDHIEQRCAERLEHCTGRSRLS